jgi:hypothetical protein
LYTVQIFLIHLPPFSHFIAHARLAGGEGETMKRIFWTLVSILISSVYCSAQNTLYFPQVADGFAGGTAWITAIAVTNTAAAGTATASGAITFTQDNGSPWSISYNDGQGGPYSTGSSIPFQIAGGQSRLFVTKANESLLTGFATVTSNGPVTGGVIFIEYNGITLERIAEAGVPASTALSRQGMFAVKGDSNTAVAVANPGSASANITFQPLDKNGAAAAPAVNRTLAAGRHSAFFIGELFPNLPQGFFGTMQIISSTPIVTIALLFESTGEFATLPVFQVQ